MLDYRQYPKRDILCIDCKSFFASVECAERGLDPMTTKLCVVSRAESQGGLVLASSPAMKQQYGIKTGSRYFEIPKHDSTIWIVPPRMSLYLERNRQINQIFLQYVAEEDHHLYSIDESFLDITRSHALFGSNYQIASQIRQQVYREYQVPLCVGIGDNLLLAKLCLDNTAKRRPPYIAYWSYERVPQTLWQIENLTDFWGIGRKTKEKLYQMGIYTVKQLAHADIERLRQRFGILGEELYYHANGVDLSRIEDSYQPRQQIYTMSQILEHDYYHKREVEVVLREMAEQLASRLRRHYMTTSCVSLYLQYSEAWGIPTSKGQLKIPACDSTKAVTQALCQLFERHYQAAPIRSLGISAMGLAVRGAMQLNLFETPEETTSHSQLDHTVDKIRERYGYQSVVHASSLVKGATAIKRAGLIGGH